MKAKNFKKLSIDKSKLDYKYIIPYENEFLVKVKFRNGLVKIGYVNIGNKLEFVLTDNKNDCQGVLTLDKQSEILEIWQQLY